MLSLAGALVRRGWDIHFFVQRSAQQEVERVGARWWHFGTEDWDLYDSAARGFRDWLCCEPPREVFPEEVMPYAVVPAILDVMPHLLRCVACLRPRFLVFDAAAPFGWVLGEVLGLPAVCCVSSLPRPLWQREKASETYSDRGRQGLDAIAQAIWNQYGVDFNHNYAYENYASYTIICTDRYWHRGNHEFLSSQFHYWGPLVSERCAAQGAGSEAVKWLLDRGGLGGRKLVFCSLGTTATAGSKGCYADSVRYLHRQILRAACFLPGIAFVVAVGRSADVYLEGIKVMHEAGADGYRNCQRLECVTKLFDQWVPSNVTVARSVDQQAILLRASVFVTHCGQNSCSEALIAGVPIVGMPLFGDQPLNARRFQELGCGQMLCQSGDPGDVEHVEPVSLAKAISKVLNDPHYGERMNAVRSWNDFDWSLSEKLAHLEAYVQFESNVQYCDASDFAIASPRS